MKIAFFESGAGRLPVKEFITGQDRETIAKVSRRIDLLEEFGSNLRYPYSEKVGNGLFALRITGSVQVRIFYAFSKNTIVLLHAFKKKSPKIPPKEIETALIRARTL